MKIEFYYRCFAAAILTINAFSASAKDYTAAFLVFKMSVLRLIRGPYSLVLIT